MRHAWKPLTLCATLALFGCSNGGTMTADTGTPDADAVAPQDTGTDASAGDATDAMCFGTAPAPGTRTCVMANCPLAALSLPSCDDPPNNYDFYGPDFCQAAATVIVISAGWCDPCMQEAPIVENQITVAMASRGVRVITVYAQNPDNSAPTLDHCQAWKTGAERVPSTPALTSHMVMDPSGMTQAFSPAGVYPSIIIVDENGIIYDDTSSNQSLDANAAISELDTLLTSEGH